MAWACIPAWEGGACQNLGVPSWEPLIRIIVYEGLYGGPPFFGDTTIFPCVAHGHGSLLGNILWTVLNYPSAGNSRSCVRWLWHIQ